jgi:hypothetical protein
MSRWWPQGWSVQDRITGTDFATAQLGDIMSPLKEYQKSMLLLSGLAQSKGFDLDRETGLNDGPGDHARANATFLTGARAQKVGGIHVGVSVDQLLAKQIGDKTRFPSLELSCDNHPSVGNCDSGYACAYQYNLSWRSATEPAPAEVNPNIVFELLFGSGGPPGETAEAKAIRERYKKSVLDFVGDDAKQINKALGTADRTKLDQYLTAVREVETRLAKEDQYMGAIPDSIREANSKDLGNGSDKKANPLFEDLARTMFDLQVLALQTDQTRIITFSYGHDGQNRAYPQLGIAEGHHDLSHYRSAGGQNAKDKVAAIDTYLMSLFAEFVGKLKAIPEGNGTLLDNCMLLYGSSLCDSDKHTHDDLPILVLGGGGGALKVGQHIDYGTHSRTPLNNLFLTLMDRMGAPNISRFADPSNHTERFGDATGMLTDIIA